MLSYLNNIKVSYKILLLLAISVFITVFQGGMELKHMRQTLEDERMVKTRHLSEAAHSVVSRFYYQYKSGALSLEEAQKQALTTLRDMRYSLDEKLQGDNNKNYAADKAAGLDYYWVNNYEAIVIMHPYSKALIGQDLRDHSNKKLHPLFSGFVDVVKQDGAGVYEYEWSKGGSKETYPKLSYVIGFEPWEWVIGTGVYIDDIDAIVFGKMINLLISMTAMVSLLAASLYFISRSITKPTQEITQAVEAIQSGQDEVTFAPGTETRRDEFGPIACALVDFSKQQKENEALRQKQKEQEQQMLLMQQEAKIDLANNLNSQVGSNVDEFLAISDQMRDISDQLDQQSSEAHSYSAEVASESEQTSMNVQTVASAAEELSASTNEIAQQVEYSTKVASDASQIVREVDDRMKSLNQASHEIGDIIALIQDIAEQTNLLALNATIEAARAGEAGKGFAVVANEVKSLATQTGRATEDIANQVGSIQDATGHAVSSMDKINSTIDDILKATTSVSTAVEQQAAAASEIAQSTAMAAGATSAVNEKIRNVQDVTQAMNQSIENFVGFSSKLQNDSQMLQSNITDFIDEIKTMQ